LLAKNDEGICAHLKLYSNVLNLMTKLACTTPDEPELLI
jgi:hypothetical protein